MNLSQVCLHKVDSKDITHLRMWTLCFFSLNSCLGILTFQNQFSPSYSFIGLHAFLLQVAPYNPAVTPTSSLDFKGRIGESHYNLKTSTEQKIKK